MTRDDLTAEERAVLYLACRQRSAFGNLADVELSNIVHELLDIAFFPISNIWPTALHYFLARRKSTTGASS